MYNRIRKISWHLPGTRQSAPLLPCVLGIPLSIKTALVDAVHLNFNPTIPTAMRLHRCCTCPWDGGDVQVLSPLAFTAPWLALSLLEVPTGTR